MQGTTQSSEHPRMILMTKNWHGLHVLETPCIAQHHRPETYHPALIKSPLNKREKPGPRSLFFWMQKWSPLIDSWIHSMSKYGANSLYISIGILTVSRILFLVQEKFKFEWKKSILEDIHPCPFTNHFLNKSNLLLGTELQGTLKGIWAEEMWSWGKS